MKFLPNGTSQHVSELLFVEVPNGMCKIHIIENVRFFHEFSYVFSAGQLLPDHIQLAGQIIQNRK